MARHCLEAGAQFLGGFPPNNHEALSQCRLNDYGAGSMSRLFWPWFAREHRPNVESADVTSANLLFVRCSGLTNELWSVEILAKPFSKITGCVMSSMVAKD